MKQQAQRGFTLIELMITVVIVGILAAIAYPAYRNNVITSNRTEGTRTLLATAQRLERCYTTSNNYQNCVTFPVVTENGYYSITATIPTAPPANTFTLSAAPQSGQADDAECGTLTLTQAGAKGEGGTGTVTDCW